MDNQRLGSIKNNSSMSIETSLLSLEIIQDYTTDEKLKNIAKRISLSPDGRLGQTKENERTLEPKSLKSDSECKAIRVSVIISPFKHIRNIVKDRIIEAEEPSCSSGAQRNKDFESSVKIIRNDSKINIYPNSEDNARRDYSSTEHPAAFFSYIIKFSDEHIITLHSSDNENASEDYTTSGPSLSSTSMFPDEHVITLHSSNEENTSNDCAT
ncbi:hypothetical protein AVEN_90690-1 [Araneus ventricosus]|uniref:Uncharacterized protein n=1 Tax=Araneus ventricosus TaxID=182803 RepID=A0A4Y2ML25_ARAVE|nr:hypothetical protein AVEN_90690-1 [Araneus ventricosus]